MKSPRRMPSAWRLFVLLPALVALPLLACQGCASGAPEDPAAPVAVEEPATADGTLVAVRQLGDSSALRDDLDRIAGDVARWAEGRRLVVIGEGDELPADAEAEVIVTLLPLADASLHDGLPVDLSGAAPVLAGERYESAETAVSLRLPGGGEAGGGEAGTGTPRWLVAGRDPRSVARLAGETVFASFGFDVDGWEESIDYMVREASYRRRAGSWQDGRAVDARDDFTADAEWFAGLEPYAHGNVVVLAPPGAKAGDMQQLGASLAATINRAAPLLPLAPGAPPVRVAVEHDYPAMIRHTGDIGLAVPGGPADLHLVVDGCCDSFAYNQALARLLVERHEELPELPPYLADGAALWLTGDWFGRRWRDWLPRVVAADVLPTAEELLAAEQPADGSRLLWAPVAAAFVASLPGETLVDKLSRLPAGTEVDAWLTALGTLADEPTERPENAVRRGGVEPLPPFMAGVSLAMLNHVDLGYHSPSVAASMDHLARTVGADAVSLMPFAFQADPNAPEMRYLNRSPGSETDVSMLHAAKRARERGVTVLWKPQIWLRSSWPGEIELTSEADRAAWFRAYRRYVVHQAVLAEHAGADLFSVGVELGKTVEHEAEWRRLIAAVRLFYAGPLTYSANWYGDFDRVPFWDALDLLGIDAYQPLSESAEASEEELRAGARRAVDAMAAAAERHGKGLVVTELGYAAHEAAWVAPHEEGGPYSEADQATAYRVMLDELGHPEWLRGVFVWKAFSNGPDDVPRRGRRTQRANFSFLDREAEAVIARYYGAR